MELPDEHELIWLFEQEPEVQDPDSPLYYNTLGFEVVRDTERLVCTVSPSYGDVELHLTRDGEPAVDLSLGHVERLSVLKENGGEALVLDFGLGGVHQLRLWLKPRIRLSWGTALVGQL